MVRIWTFGLCLCLLLAVVTASFEASRPPALRMRAPNAGVLRKCGAGLIAIHEGGDGDCDDPDGVGPEARGGDDCGDPDGCTPDRQLRRLSRGGDDCGDPDGCTPDRQLRRLSYGGDDCGDPDGCTPDRQLRR
mmetsp:Transcript_24252/g.38103  ORF Transcript_24252/g.38103 Transcript_24252/m.38103 type:complete len:133 (+) Transcript_24252:192-590(+)